MARSLEGCCSIQLSYWRKHDNDSLYSKASQRSSLILRILQGLGRAGGMSRSGRGIPAKNSQAERGVRHCFQVDCGLSPLYASARLEYGLYF